MSESTTRGDFSQHFLHPRTLEDDRGALISVQLSTTVSAAAIHTSSCTAVVDEHHTGHQLQELHPAGKLQHRLKLVEIDDADNECTPPHKRDVQQQLLDSTLLNLITLRSRLSQVVFST